MAIKRMKKAKQEDTPPEKTVEIERSQPVRVWLTLSEIRSLTKKAIEEPELLSLTQYLTRRVREIAGEK